MAFFDILVHQAFTPNKRLLIFVTSNVDRFACLQPREKMLKMYW
jgi:hypothetical protein